MFGLSLRANHPEWPLQRLIEGLGSEPDYGWSKGDPDVPSDTIRRGAKNLPYHCASSYVVDSRAFGFAFKSLLDGLSNGASLSTALFEQEEC
jgi:hypothetical protein